MMNECLPHTCSTCKSLPVSSHNESTFVQLVDAIVRNNWYFRLHFEHVFRSMLLLVIVRCRKLIELAVMMATMSIVHRLPFHIGQFRSSHLIPYRLYSMVSPHLITIVSMETIHLPLRRLMPFPPLDFVPMMMKGCVVAVYIVSTYM